MEFAGPPPVVKLENLTKVFVTDEVETHALEDVNIQIARGEYVSISGPSGCGKSTLLSILGLLDVPSSGTVRLRGRAVQALTLTERARVRNREIGFVFQAFNLIGDLKVHENVALPLTYRGMNASERRRRLLRRTAGRPGSACCRWRPGWARRCGSPPRRT